jgi:hypothetical protein
MVWLVTIVVLLLQVPMYLLGFPMLVQPLGMALATIWCWRNRAYPITVSVFSVKAQYLPLIMFIVHMLGRYFVVLDLLGIAVGFIFIALKDILPQHNIRLIPTPRKLFEWFP